MDLLLVVELIQFVTVITGALYLHFVARPRFVNLEQGVAKIDEQTSP